MLLTFTLGEEEVTGPVPSLGWLLARRPAHDAAAVGGRGVRVPRLPQPGDRRLDPRPAGGRRRGRASSRAPLFSAAHGPQDLLTFLDRFAFGLAASAVVWLTGGLEAAIVLHAVNNVLVFVLAGALGEGVATEEVPAGSGLGVRRC